MAASDTPKRPKPRKKSEKKTSPISSKKKKADGGNSAVTDRPYAIPSPKAKPKDLVEALYEYEEGGHDDRTADETIDPEALERGDIPMTVVGHLDELRSRIIKSLIVIAVITVAAFVFSDEILAYLTKPFTATGFKLNIFKLTEGFVIRLKVSAILALLLGLPFLLWQGWRFILPAVSRKDRMFSRLSLLASAVLFYAGVAFVFYLLVPLTVKVLLGFVAKDMNSTIGADDYITLVFFFCVIMGVLFELPIVMMVLTRIGIITPSYLLRKRKYAIVLSFVLSAVITPTQDILTMCVVAVPLILLYEVSILVSKLTVVRKKKKELSG